MHSPAAEWLNGHTARAYGFPAGHPDGVWAYATLQGLTAAGLLQLAAMPANEGYFIAPGFSGAPLWDAEAGGVVGIVVSREHAPGIRAAFALPIDHLRKELPPGALATSTAPQLIPPSISGRNVMITGNAENTVIVTGNANHIVVERHTDHTRRLATSPERESVMRALHMARRSLRILEEQAAGYTALTIPAHLRIELEEKRREVDELERRLQNLGG